MHPLMDLQATINRPKCVHKKMLMHSQVLHK